MGGLDRKELDKIATISTEVENPDIYSKDITHINKPVANIKFGHILNVNWDNILNTFRIIQKFFKETILNQDVSTSNIANKIVKRNADKSIEIGDIYCSSAISEKINTIPAGAGVPFKNPATGEIVFTKDYASFRKLTNTISQDDMNAVERLDINGSGDFTMWGGQRVINLNEKARKYRLLIINMGGTSNDLNFVILLPNQLARTMDTNRHGGAGISALWNGETSITVRHYPWRDGGTGQVAGVWGLI